MALGGLTTALGFIVLSYCAWEVSRYRDMLKLTQQDFTGLPQHLQLQLLVATVLCSIGGLIVSGKMKPIVLSKGAPSVDVGSFRPDFVVVNHRGKCLPGQVAAATAAG